MKIALKKSDRIVTHASGNIRFSSMGLIANGVIHPSMTEETAEIISVDSLPDPWEVGRYTFENDVFTLIDPNWTPEPEPVELDILSTDTWTIPADGTTVATITYTSDDTTVYFAVDSESYGVEPIDSVATLEVTADASGPIQVAVKSQRLVLTALEVEE